MKILHSNVSPPVVNLIFISINHIAGEGLLVNLKS